MRKIMFILASLLVLASCSTNVVPVTKDKLAPYQGSVIIFFAEDQAPAIYKVIVAITHYDWGKYRQLTIDDALPILEEKAQAQGANAVIIDSCETVYSGIFSRGIDVKARAILIK
jgi:hypothetical protein